MTDSTAEVVALALAIGGWVALGFAFLLVWLSEGNGGRRQ